MPILEAGIIKKLARLCITAGCQGSGVLARRENAAARQLWILCYHRILPADRKAAYFEPGLVVTPEAFRDHCRILQQRCHVLPLSEAVEVWSGNPADRRPLAVITFDDGYQDNYRFAEPILAEFKLRATFFVISDLVGTARRPWYDVVAESYRHPEMKGRTTAWMSQYLSAPLSGHSNGCAAREVVALAKRLGADARHDLLSRLAAPIPMSEANRDDCIMTAEQLRELQNRGHEIGSHSRTHEILPQLCDEALEEEVAGSRRQLEAVVRPPIRAFCYPNGDVTDRVVRATVAAGYLNAVTTEVGANSAGHDLHRLNRWFIHEERLTGLRGVTSEGLMRMELVGLSERLFRRGSRRTARP